MLTLQESGHNRIPIGCAIDCRRTRPGQHGTLAKPGCPPQITVKVYAADVDEAAARAILLYDTLMAKYALAEAQP